MNYSTLEPVDQFLYLWANEQYRRNNQYISDNPGLEPHPEEFFRKAKIDIYEAAGNDTCCHDAHDKRKCDFLFHK